MTLESLGWIVLLLGVIGLGCYWLDVQEEQREREHRSRLRRELDAFETWDWRERQAQAGERRRVELDALARERFQTPEIR